MDETSGKVRVAKNQADRQLEIDGTIVLLPDWKLQDLSSVAFAEDSQSGVVLQVVRLEY